MSLKDKVEIKEGPNPLAEIAPPPPQAAPVHPPTKVPDVVGLLDSRIESLKVKKLNMAGSPNATRDKLRKMAREENFLQSVRKNLVRS